MRIVTDYKHAQQIIVELDAEVERLQARVDELEADIRLLAPVCSASSGGMVDGVMCPRCKGNGFVASTEQVKALEGEGK